MSADELDDALDRVEQTVASDAPFDLSPRGVRFRPEGELERQIEAVAERGDEAVAPLQRRLGDSPDPLAALVWLSILNRVGTAGARGAMDDYAARIERDDPWPEAFPGRRELLLYLGRDLP